MEFRDYLIVEDNKIEEKVSSHSEFSDNVEKSQENMNKIERLIFDIKNTWSDKQRSVGSRGAVQLVKETENYIDFLENTLKNIKKVK